MAEAQTATATAAAITQLIRGTAQGELVIRRREWDTMGRILRDRFALWLAEQPEVTQVGEWHGSCLPFAVASTSGEFGMVAQIQ